MQGRIFTGFCLDLFFNISSGFAGGAMCNRGVERVQLVFEEDFPVGVLHNAETGLHDLDFTFRRPVTHIIKGGLGTAKPCFQIRPFFGKAGKNEAAIAGNARGSFHAAVRIALFKAGLVISFRRRDCMHRTVEIELPGMIGTDEVVAGIAHMPIGQHRTAMWAAVK